MGAKHPIRRHINVFCTTSLGLLALVFVLFWVLSYTNHEFCKWEYTRETPRGAIKLHQRAQGGHQEKLFDTTQLWLTDGWAAVLWRIHGDDSNEVSRTHLWIWGIRFDRYRSASRNRWFSEPEYATLTTVRIHFGILVCLTITYPIYKLVRFLIARRVVRLRLTQGRCTGCGYLLSGLVGDACPECGAEINAEFR